MSEGGDDLIRWTASAVERARLPLALAGAASSAVMLRYANIIGSRLRHSAVYNFIVKLLKWPDMLEVLGDGTRLEAT